MTRSSPPVPPPIQAVTGYVSAHAWLDASPDRLAELRRCPGPGPGKALSTSFLKNADEQTVVGLSAVCHAIHNHQLASAAWTDWAVVAGPHLPGRGAMVAAIERYRAEGAWGISPNLIPHRSLHSLPGTISQALKMHGPNFGAGSASEAIFCAAGLLAEETVPGVWLVLTAWQSEALLDQTCTKPQGATCTALALALTPVRATRNGLRLTVTTAGSGCRQDHDPSFDPLRLHRLMELVLASTGSLNRVAHALDNGGRIEVLYDPPDDDPSPVASHLQFADPAPVLPAPEVAP